MIVICQVSIDFHSFPTMGALDRYQSSPSQGALRICGKTALFVPKLRKFGASPAEMDVERTKNGDMDGYGAMNLQNHGIFNLQFSWRDGW